MSATSKRRTTATTTTATAPRRSTRRPGTRRATIRRRTTRRRTTRRRAPALATTVGTALGALAVAALLNASPAVRTALVVAVLGAGAAYVLWRHRTEVSRAVAPAPDAAVQPAEPPGSPTEESPS